MPVIGIDLGKSSIRAVELDKKKDAIYLNNFGSYDNPRLNVDSNSKEDVDFFVNTLKDFLSDVGFSTPNTFVGLDESQVFMRIIKLPIMSDKELKTSVKYESEQYIPIPLDQVNVSFQKLDPDFLEKDKVNVQIVAAKKDVLDRYVEVMKRSGLLVKSIEPETIALGRVLGDSAESPLGTMIINVGLMDSLILVNYAGFVRFTRTVGIGGDTLTKTVQQSLNLEIDQAEEYKKIYGMDRFQGDGKVYEVIKPVIDNLIMEIKRASMFFTKHNPSANIKRVILTGGTALMPGLLQYIASNLDSEVQVADPLKGLVLSPTLEKQKGALLDRATSYSVAIGLAMRGLI